MAIPSNFNIGGLYTSDVDKGLYNSPNIWVSKVIGQVNQNEPFVVLDSGDFAQKSFLQILTLDGTIGFVRVFATFNEEIKEVVSNEG